MAGIGGASQDGACRREIASNLFIPRFLGRLLASGLEHPADDTATLHAKRVRDRTPATNVDRAVVADDLGVDRPQNIVRGTQAADADRRACHARIDEGEDRVGAIVPGTAFGESGEGFARISYAYSLNHIKEALKRIEAFVKTLK